MIAYLTSLAAFWGVWLLVPVLVDGMSMLLGLVGMLANRWVYRKPPVALAYAPDVTIVIPVYNSADTLPACLESLARQDYPHRKMQVLLMNNKSTDVSQEVFAHYQNETDLNLSWHSIAVKGKSWALNAGIHLAEGQYIFNIDSDVVLREDTIRRAVMHFESTADLGAITGYLEILPDRQAGEGPRLHDWLTGCEYLEYLTVFGVGRSYQSLMHAVYTLSGAFTAFRRDALVNTFLYNPDTVSEDTDLTFQFYERMPDYRVANFPDVRIYIQPIPSLAAMYSQRVRWQRGQLEVSALHQQLLRRRAMTLLRFSPARALLVDHTLAFPRLVWMAFLPVLMAFGYSAGLLVMSYLLVYLFYLLLDAVWIGAAYIFADEATRKAVRERLLVLPLLPFYRVMLFFFRFSGFLLVMAEPGSWGVTNPVAQVVYGWQDVRELARGLWLRLRQSR